MATDEQGARRDTRWPNLFLIGAAKAGTTSLYGHLADHPEIYMSAVKEPHYFAGVTTDPDARAFFPVVETRRAYLRLFAKARHERWVGEASTSYLWDPEAPRRIQAHSSAASILVLLRDPVERAFSHYLDDVREGRQRLSFEDAVEHELEHGPPTRWGELAYVDPGHYVPQVIRWREVVGDRLLPLIYEEFFADRQSALNELFDCLGVGRQSSALKSHRQNAFSVPRHPFAAAALSSARARAVARSLLTANARARARRRLIKVGPKPDIEPKLRAHLNELYTAGVRDLEDLLGRRVPWAMSPGGGA